MRKSRIVRAAAVIEQPALVTLPNIELLEVGDDWETSTGIFSFTSEDLASCVTSQEDPAIRTPVIKLGHIDPRFDGQPSIGRVLNMRVDNNGQTLVGDFVGLPLWLAQVMASAYPRRSIEGVMNWSTRTGNEWPMVLTGVALLGDAYPAIETLEDIQALWGSTIPVLLPVEDVEEIAASSDSRFYARKVDDMSFLRRSVKAAATKVKASINLDAIRSEYYNSLGPAQNWWWIREIRVNPMTLIVDDDQGGLVEVPVTISANDEITFGEPTAVKIQYVAASGSPVAETHAGQVVAATNETPEAAGRTSRPTSEGGATLSPEPTATTEEIEGMLTEEELAALGLPPDATREQISAAIMGKAEEPETPPANEPETPPANEPETPPEPTTPEIPEGMVLVDAATLQELRTGVAVAASLAERQAKADRDEILDTAIRAGKFPLGRRKHYETMLSADPIGAKALIASLEPGLIPVAETGVQTGDVVAASETSYPEGWKNSIRAGRSDRVKVVQD